MKKILFYGAGNISQALIMGLLSSGFNKNNIEYIDRNLSNQKSYLDDISIYPNPSANYLFLNNIVELEAKVYDLNGKLILTEFITNKLDISCLDKGYYIIKFSDGSNELIHKIIRD